jgi:hypothetical protein
MLFRKYDGTIIEIIKNNCKNDEIYYNKIMASKCSNNEKKYLPPNISSSYSIKLLISFLQDCSNNSDNQEEDEE